MQLAILHYHLNRGGVARVVENHLKALAKNKEAGRPSRVLLIQGRLDTNWSHAEVGSELPFPIELVTLESLDYDEPDALASASLGQSLESVLSSHGFWPENTLLHWHNHSLGKNVSAPLAVRHLASEGYSTLLQIHDFAEDFRPENYRKLKAALVGDKSTCLTDVIYPQSRHVHYAALNERDRAILGRMGVPEDRLHLLQNPVAAFGTMPDKDQSRERINQLIDIPPSRRLISYPVRGIRRKNVGEMLLWSTLLENTSFFITLTPENPVERASFDRWQRLAAELRLPCRFGTPEGVNLSFKEILSGSDALLTTSVAEGFGMAFLEAWLADRKLVGRSLLEITVDATEAGINLSELYDELVVPCCWIDRDAFIQQFAQIASNVYESFGIDSPSAETMKQQLISMVESETIDFARLPADLQSAVIRRVHECTIARNEMFELNPRLNFSECESEAVIRNNASIVSERFSLDSLGRCLGVVYDRVMKSEVELDLTGPSNGSAVLDAFLSIDRLHPIRVQP